MNRFPLHQLHVHLCLQSCETMVHKDKTEITKKCKKTKDCKTRCDANAVECHFCCTGDLCNKDQGNTEG